MPKKQTVERARRDKRKGKSASTQAGEFVREEMHHIREGKHGARSTKQAIAIGLSKARRAGVGLPPPEKGTVRKDAAQRAARLPGGSKTQTQGIAAPLECHRARAQTGRPECGVKKSPLAAGAFRGAKAHTNRTLGVGTPSSANQRPQRTFRRSSQSGAHPSTADKECIFCRSGRRPS
jgi:Family of unknown function (DUF6496)